MELKQIHDLLQCKDSFQYRSVDMVSETFVVFCLKTKQKKKGFRGDVFLLLGLNFGIIPT